MQGLARILHTTHEATQFIPLQVSAEKDGGPLPFASDNV